MRKAALIGAALLIASTAAAWRMHPRISEYKIVHHSALSKPNPNVGGYRIVGGRWTMHPVSEHHPRFLSKPVSEH